MGRPTKLTTEIAGRICHHTRAGNYADTAAAFVGICRKSFHNWLTEAARIEAADPGAEDSRAYARWTAAIDGWLTHLGWSPRRNVPGEPDETERDRPGPPAGPVSRADSNGAWVAFLHAVEKAQAESEVRDMAGIGAHGRKEWQALAWRRERMQPDRYGRRGRLELSGPGEEPVQVSAQIAQVVFHLPVNGRERVTPETAGPVPGAPRRPAAGRTLPDPGQRRIGRQAAG